MQVTTVLRELRRGKTSKNNEKFKIDLLAVRLAKSNFTTRLTTQVKKLRNHADGFHS